jgi:tRNA(His) 5'-end guanylyltransferase
MSDELGDRMKGYENITRTYLSPKQYYVLRIDGKAFHTYTKGLDRPFDEGMIEDMQETMKFLCENIQGAQFGYTQSDDITIVFTDLMSREADIWFGGNIQKITSVAASLATSKFNQLRMVRAITPDYGNQLDETAVADAMVMKQAQFDARVFPLSQRYEVLNCLWWRMQDAAKNSVQMQARAYYSHKELQGKNTAKLKEMLMSNEDDDADWYELPVTKQHGSSCYKKFETVAFPDMHPDIKIGEVPVRTKWYIDNETPVFKQDWSWFNDKIYIDLEDHD